MTYKLVCGCVKAHCSDAATRRGEVQAGAILRPCQAHGGSALTDAIPATARNRYAAGRRVSVPLRVRTARDLIRRYLREEGHNMRDLAAPWNVKPETVKSIMHYKRPLAPQHIDAVIEFLKLDEFDSMELRIQGAIEAGWQIAGIEKARL